MSRTLRPVRVISRGSTVAADLARSCHPAPTVAVTAFVIVLAAAAGNDAGTCALLAAAVLAGQLSIGWSNDRIDADRDRIAGRLDKPIASGRLAVSTVDRVTGGAVLAAIGLSLALGWRAGLLHLAAVGCGWLYNFVLKSTWWSWLPYAAAFAALPAIATLALPGHPAPAGWVVVAGALLGVGANLTNALPDLAGDRQTGVIGLPHHLGARASLLLAAVLLLGASVCVALGPRDAPRPASWVGLGIAVVLVLGGAPTALRRPTSRRWFYVLVGIVAIDLVLILTTGRQLR